MARVLRQNRIGIAIIAVAVVVLLVVIFWVRGCDNPQTPPPENQEGTLETPVTQELPKETIESAKTETIPTPAPAPSPEPKPKPTDSKPEPKPPAPQTKSVYDRWFAAGREAFDRGEYVDARNQLSQALKGLKDPTRVNAQVMLATIAKKLTFSPQVFPGDTTAELYQVKQGEYPAGVAKGFCITAELFMKINNIHNAKSMMAGKNYKLIKGPFNVVIHKKTFELDVFLGDYFIKRYPIGLGRDNSSPVGEFLAGSRLKQPQWIGDDKETGRRIRIPYGDPRNPLGDHWISLRELSEHGGKDTTYGIHGTNEPRSIGTLASRGCVRMLNEDVAELFDLLVSGKSRITLLAD